MDWPTRSIFSRIRWMVRGRRLQAKRLAGDVWTKPAHVPSRQEDVRESLHSLDRAGRLPLLVLVATDRRGEVIDMCACDAEDYDR
jgi:hypothetical protein